MAEPRNRYSVVSLVLHWVIAAAVLTQVLLVTAHEATEGPISREFINLHKSVGLTILAWLSIACGLILDTVTQGRREAKRMAYLSIPSRY